MIRRRNFFRVCQGNSNATLLHGQGTHLCLYALLTSRRAIGISTGRDRLTARVHCSMKSVVSTTTLLLAMVRNPVSVLLLPFWRRSETHVCNVPTSQPSHTPLLSPSERRVRGENHGATSNQNGGTLPN